MHYGKRSSRQRPHDAANLTRAPSSASAGPSPRQPIRIERKNRSEMAQPRRSFRRADGAESKEHGPDPAEESVIVEFRFPTLLPPDDVLGCLKDTIPNRSRSALHRCLQRHGISQLPEGRAAEKRKQFKTYEIGYVHIGSAELTHADGKFIMFLAIGRVPNFTYVEFHEHAGKMEAFPYKIHKVLTDNGMAFANLP
jgi:hypothetical protein